MPWVDETTLSTSKAEFARVSVEIGLSKPLVVKFWFRRQIKHLEYEWLQAFCFSYVLYGHEKECMVIKKSTTLLQRGNKRTAQKMGKV